MMFSPGDKVKCIDAKPRVKKKIHHALHKGEIYTVRRSYVSSKHGIACVCLEEITAKPNPNAGFHADRFILHNPAGSCEHHLALKMLRDLLKGAFE